ncbi:K(+)/H(+) antiporter [Mortierella alpina]|nr:K(+)/H(+) antiporter [Mortierella alpina]
MATNGTAGKTQEGGNILSGGNPIKFSMEDPLPLFIVQTVIILSLCYVMNIFMHRIRQPRVVSEVLSGIILGPSIMGKIPGFQETIFPKESVDFLHLVANLGLVLFLFLVGLELDPKLILKRAKHALGISVAGLLIPLAFSGGVATLLYHQFEQPTAERPSPPFGEFFLTCGVAMSLTAFPVLARILAEMQLMSTTVGFITVCAAAAGDIVAWILMALLVSLINATTPIMPVYVLLMAIGWCIVLFYAVRPLLLSLVRLTHSEEEPSQKMIAITLVIVLTSAFVTNAIGIHAIFGGFLVGLLIPHDSGFAEGLTRRIEDLVGVYFLPIFFACSGLKTQVGLLNNGLTWGLVIMVTLISFLGKMIGCVGAARANGMTWRESVSIGFLMQCKGLVEYIILNLGHDAGVISDHVFVILISMCIFLTMVTTPFVSYLYPVSYQKELEVRREAERKKKALKARGRKDDKKPPSQPKGFLSRLTSRLRRRRGATTKKDQEDPQGEDRYEDLDGVQTDDSDRDADRDEEETKEEHTWKKRNSIMFCLDKTPNAPGVMTLLQLFSGTAIHRHPKSLNPRGDGAATRGEKSGEGSENTTKGHHGVLQPSIDISDPEGNRRQKQGSKAIPEYEVGYSKIYAIRLLHISERTSAAMLTASRCMDRLYKDTVMMMVMAFAKLNSVPLKPLVAISTDAAQSTVAQDILDRAEDLNVGWIVYPWNSSHLTDLPSSVSGLPSGGGHLQPGIMMSIANTTATAHSTITIPGTPTGTSDPAHAATLFATLPDSTPEPPRQFPYNISRYFDHDEAQKIASGGHVDLTQSGQSHRTSIASNTKVLSKLIPSSASSNIATAVLVDRGLGLFGGVEHLVVPLLGGEDDYESLCLASCLARSTRCFVTILRIATSQNSAHPQPSAPSDGQQRTFQTHSQLSPSMPGSPDTPMHRPQDGPSESAKFSRHSARISEDRTESKPQPNKRSTIDLVPKDDETLFKKFFPCKPPFQGDSQRHRQQILQKNISLDRTGLGHYAQRSHSFLESQADEEDVDDFELEEGIMVLGFQELADAILWARSCLTAQDLMVIGFDSPLNNHSSSTGHHEGLSNRSLTGFSRVPSMEDGRLGGVDGRLYSSSVNSSQVASPPSILERRGVNLSPPHSESPYVPPAVHQRLQPLQNTSLNASVVSTASGVHTPLPQAAFDEERTGRSRAIGSTRAGRSLSRKARSLRSLSRGRKAETPGAGASSSHHIHLGGGNSSATTCQVMLGFAADRLMQSCVSSSLLVVRSRWFAERSRNANEAASTFAGVGQFKLHMTPSVISHHRRRSSEQSYQRMHDQTRQYHSQQQQHHARQHSKLSEELIRDLDRDGDPVLRSTSSARARAPDVTFVDMSGSGQSRGGRNDMETPRMSRESL